MDATMLAALATELFDVNAEAAPLPGELNVNARLDIGKKRTVHLLQWIPGIPWSQAGPAGGRRLRHPAVGDVRGRGLFLGVDLVVDRVSRDPDQALAKRVVEAAKRDGVLLSTDGPGDNVLKIKPPLVLGMEQAGRAADVLDRALTEAARRRDLGLPT